MIRIKMYVYHWSIVAVSVLFSYHKIRCLCKSKESAACLCFCRRTETAWISSQVCVILPSAAKVEAGTGERETENEDRNSN